MSLPKASGAEVSLDRLIALGSFAAAKGVTGRSHGTAGGLSGPRRGEGGDLFDLRPYQQGDDVRRIDPAATARSGRPQVRSRHEEVEETMLLVADFRSSMLWGTRGRLRSVAAAEALALDGWCAVLAGARVGVLILGDSDVDYVAPRSRETAMLRVASALARAHVLALDARGTAPATLATLLGDISARAAPGTVVRLATGLDDPGADFGPAAAALMRKCQLGVLLVQDAVEIEPPRGIFAAQLGRRIARGRFGASGSAEFLENHGIPARIVHAAQPIDEQAA